MIKRLSHVGFLVKDIEGATKLYEDLLGVKPWRHGVLNHPSDGLKNTKLALEDTETDIELLQATDAQSPIGKAMARRGEGIYHLCFVTDDLDAEMARLRAMGATVIERKPGPTLTNRGCWIHPRSTTGVLIELVEQPTK